MNPEMIYRFGNFELEPESGEFRRGGIQVRLPGKPLQLLTLLLERAPEVVSREQMRQRMWPAGIFVDFDRNLNAAMKKLREALDDSAETPRFIETMPRRGYRFIAPVETAPRSNRTGPAQPPAPTALSHLAWVPAPGRAASRALLLVVVLAALLTTSFNPAATATPERDDCPPRFTLAVLPFQEHPHGKNHQHLADGLAETLAVRLTAWNPARLGVVSRRSVEKYRCSAKSVAEIGGELGVTFVVDGSVRRQGDRLRVTAEFIQVSDQTQIWSHTFELPADEITTIHEQLSQGVLKAVAACLLPAPGTREVAANLPNATGKP